MHNSLGTLNKTSKFKVLKYNEMFMNCLGVRPYRFDQDSNEFFESIRAIAVLVVSLCSTISCVTFVQQNWPHLDVVSQACVVSIAMLQSGGMFSSFGLNMKTMKAVHRELQGIVDGQRDSNLKFLNSASLCFISASFQILL